MNCRYHPAAQLIPKTVKVPRFSARSLEQLEDTHARTRIILCCPVEDCPIVAQYAETPELNDTCDRCGKHNIQTATEAEFITMRNYCKPCKKAMQAKRTQRLRERALISA